MFHVFILNQLCFALHFYDCVCVSLTSGEFSEMHTEVLFPSNPKCPIVNKIKRTPTNKILVAKACGRPSRMPACQHGMDVVPRPCRRDAKAAVLLRKIIATRTLREATSGKSDGRQRNNKGETFKISKGSFFAFTDTMKSRLALELALRYAPARPLIVSSVTLGVVPGHAFRKTSKKARLSSSLAVASAPWDDSTSYRGQNLLHDTQEHDHAKHCETCTCRNDPNVTGSNDPSSEARSFPCGSLQHEDDYGVLPPPLSEPVYSVHKRVLPSNLLALSSPQGRKYLIEALQNDSAESYFSLMEQFVNQSDPAFCGVTTLLMILNAMSIDPNVRWRGGWRFYGSEDVLLDRCCLSAERIRRVGISMEEFRLLGQCHGLKIKMFRAISEENVQRVGSGRSERYRDEYCTEEEFRNDIRRILKQSASAEEGLRSTRNSVIVTSFSRAALGQTGDGHFSPLAAWHEETDQVLLLDVARFKYSPYWVSVTSLYESMIPIDSATKKSRGWFIMHPPDRSQHELSREDRRPAEVVPRVGENACPVSTVKINFCPANPKENKV